MDALDERIRRQDLQRTAIRGRNGRIVADADEEPGRRRGDAHPNPLNQRALADVRDALLQQVTGRTQRPGSP